MSLPFEQAGSRQDGPYSFANQQQAHRPSYQQPQSKSQQQRFYGARGAENADSQQALVPGSAPRPYQDDAWAGVGAGFGGSRAHHPYGDPSSGSYPQRHHGDQSTPVLAAESVPYVDEKWGQQEGHVSDSNSASGTARPSSRIYADPDAGWKHKHDSGEFTYGAAKDGRNKKKFWVLLAILISVLVVVGAVVGVLVYMLHKRSASSSGKGASGSDNSVDLSDPSKFEKDDRLHQSFYGMCYTPFDSQYQYGCGANLTSIIHDVQLLSQLTTRVRLYGSDCNVTAMMLQAIQETKTNLTIFPAIYLNQEDPNDAAWDRQVNNITIALNAYGTTNVGGVTVGNEYLLGGGSSTNLLAYVEKFRTIASQNSWTFPIGTADAGSEFTTAVAQGVDYFMANVHAWFAGTLVQDGPAWTYEYFEENDQAIAGQVSNKPTAYIAETGWPSGANDTAHMTYVNEAGEKTGAVAGVDQLQTFLDGYVCNANKNGTGYFFFEMYDEKWKEIYGGVEPYWGLFDENKNLKDLTLPNCSHN